MARTENWDFSRILINSPSLLEIHSQDFSMRGKKYRKISVIIICTKKEIIKEKKEEEEKYNIF